MTGTVFITSLNNDGRDRSGTHRPVRLAARRPGTGAA